MKIFGICLLVVALTAPTFADDKKAKVDEDPIVFGITGQNTGCVIFRQYTEKNTKFWGVAISQSRVSALEVIETQNYRAGTEEMGWPGRRGRVDSPRREGQTQVRQNSREIHPQSARKSPRGMQGIGRPSSAGTDRQTSRLGIFTVPVSCDQSNSPILAVLAGI